MTVRLGISLEKPEWKWVTIAIGAGGRSRVVKSGSVREGDWDAIAREAGPVSSVGLALPDTDVVVRRLRIGHPPGSAIALRQLARWRLKDDLPFAAAALDAALENEHALVIAADRLRVESLEASSGPACGPVERVTSAGLACLGLVPPPSSGSVAVLDAGSHVRATFENGVLSSIRLLEGAPDEPSTTVVERRQGLTIDVGVDWGSVSDSSRGAYLAAVGAACDGLGLNLASHPPVPAAARRVAWGVAVGAAVLAVLMAAMAAQASQAVATERRLIVALQPPAQETVPVHPEVGALRAIVEPPAPEWTRLLAAMERDLPRSARLDRLVWRDGQLLVTVVGTSEELDAAKAALERHGIVRPLTQGGAGTSGRVEFALGGPGSRP